MSRLKCWWHGHDWTDWSNGALVVYRSCQTCNKTEVRPK
jgi:hypothetical protein